MNEKDVVGQIILTVIKTPQGNRVDIQSTFGNKNELRMYLKSAEEFVIQQALVAASEKPPMITVPKMQIMPS